MSNCALEIVYCDDIRAEVGNKPSLMGVYPVEMLVEKFPITLPKFCVWANLATPVEHAPKQIRVRLMQEERPVLDTGEIALSEAIGDARPVDGVFVTSFSLAISPFQLDGETWLQAIADCNGETLTSRRFAIRQRS